MPQRQPRQQPVIRPRRRLPLAHAGSVALLLALNGACGSEGARLDAEVRNADLGATPAPPTAPAQGPASPAVPRSVGAPDAAEGGPSGQTPVSNDEANPEGLAIASPMLATAGPGASGPGSEPPASQDDFCRPAPTGPIPAFPGAKGFGAFAQGGRYGDVYHVTNLASSGAGSFADGLLNVPAAGRTIVFDVSGYASISGTLNATAARLTIAGQTAPGDGFGLRDGAFLLSAGEAVIRHLRFRNGLSGDSVDMDTNAINLIWDHCGAVHARGELSGPCRVLVCRHGQRWQHDRSRRGCPRRGCSRGGSGASELRASSSSCCTEQRS